MIPSNTLKNKQVKGEINSGEKIQSKVPITKTCPTTSLFIDAYLITYNLLSSMVWGFLLCKLVYLWLLHASYENIFNETFEWTKLIQTMALLEIVHILTGLVKSELLTTIIQVSSRLLLVWGICNPMPWIPRYSIFYNIMVFSWSLIEIIRYSYYVSKITGFSSAWLLWARYTFFYILYPLGATSEWMLMYLSFPSLVRSGIYSIRMPNALNFAFDYSWCIALVLFSYFFGFPVQYMHMIRQRRKYLKGTPSRRC